MRGDGRLLSDRAERTGSDRYRHDPEEPVPTLGGRHLIWVVNPPGPAEQTPVEERRDVLVYTSEPLDRDVTVARPRARRPLRLVERSAQPTST